MVGLGSAFRLPGLQKYLQEKLQLEVRKPNNFNRLVGDEVVNAPVFTENVLGFAVPYGLALQGVGLAKLHTNLLPQEIRFDRMIRAKKPWAVAAAAALFLGAGLLTMGYAVNFKAVNAAEITKAIQRSDGAIQTVTGKTGEDKKKEGEIASLTSDVMGVIAGKEEQLDWLLLNRFIAAQLPQPDGSNLKENPRQTRYWNTEEAKNARSEYLDRIRGGAKADQPMPDEMRQNLVLVDVEAIDARYTENLKQVFDNAQRAILKGAGFTSFLDAGMCKYDVENPPKETPPEGAGWVIEIRGSTFHKNRRQFVLDTLLRNLAVNGRLTLPLETAGGAAPGAPPAAPATPPPGAPADATSAALTATATVSPHDEEAMTKAVIKDRARWVFLFKDKTDTEPKPGAFQIINQSYLPEVMSAPATGAPGQPAAAPTESGGRSSWQPLTAAGGGDSNSGGRLAGGKGGPAAAPPAMRSPAALIPAVPAVGAEPPATAKPSHPRYEFVIMFFWQEPTPSDKLMKLANAPPPATTGPAR
jgi:hypothetical protein